MSRSRRQGSNSISLFPFLAVLVCAMGALIFLLLVTTQRIRRDAVARAAQEAAAPLIENAKPPVTDEESSAHIETEPTLVAISEEVSPEDAAGRELTASAATIIEPKSDAKSAADLSPPKPVVAAIDPNEALHRRLAQIAAARDDKLAVLRDREAAMSAALQRLDDTKETAEQARVQLQQLDARGADVASAQHTVADEQVRIMRQIVDSQDKISQVRQQRTAASSRFAFVPFDGRTGTTRRPIFIECTRDGLRFVPENILVTDEQLQGFTVGYNPVLAGAQALMDHWSRKRTSADDPRPYVLLLVRPGGSMSYYLARKVLERVGDSSGYELVDDRLPLDFPQADPEAVAVCRAAVERTLAARDRHRAPVAKRRYTTDDFRFTRGDGAFTFEGFRPGSARSDSAGDGGSRGYGRYSGTGGGSAATGRDVGDRSGRYGSNSAEQRHEFSRSQSATANREGRDVDRLNRGSTGSYAGADSHADRGSDGDASQRPVRPLVMDFRKTGDGAGGRESRGSRDDVDASRRRGEIGSHSAGNSETPPESAATNRLAVNADGTRIADHGDQTGTGDSVSAGTAWGREPRQGGNTSSGGSASTDPHDAQGQPGASPTLSISRQFGEGGPSSGTASRKWGFHSKTASIGFERDVRVDVYLDRLVVADEYRISAGRGESREELLGQTVRALDRYAQSWGHPPRNFYWVPSVKFIVRPGGNRHYERLHDGLRGWGLTTSVTYMLDDADDSLPELTQ